MSLKAYGSPCSAVGCALRAGTNLFSTIKMFSFPKDPERRRQWTAALNRKDFKPSKKSRICSKHFITGKRSDDPQHPDYVPSKFDHNKKCGPKEDKRKMERYERSTRRLEAMTPIGTPSKDRQHPDYIPPLFSYGRNTAKRTARKSMKSGMVPHFPKFKPDRKNVTYSTDEWGMMLNVKQEKQELQARKARTVKQELAKKILTKSSTEEASEDGEHQHYDSDVFSNEYDTGKRTARKSMKSGRTSNSLNLKPVQICSRSTGTPPVIKQDATTMTQLTGSEIDRLQKTIQDQTKMLSSQRNYVQLANKPSMIPTPGKVLYVVSMQSR